MIYTRSKCFSTNTDTYCAHCWLIRNASVKAEALFFFCFFCLFDSLFSSNWKKRQPTPQLGSLRCDSEKTHGCLSPADCLGWGCALPPALLWVSAAHPRREPRPHPRARGSPGSAEPARPSPRAPQCRWCSGISRPRRGPCGPGTHSPCGPLTAPRPRAGSTRSPSPGRRRYRPSERRVPVRGRAPPRSEHRLLPAGPQDAGGSGASASGAAGLSGSPRPAPSEPPSPLPRPAPLRGWAGRRHPPASGTSSRRRRRPRPGQGPGERRAGKWRPGRAELRGRSRTMRLLRALLRGAAPGSASPANIPQQVDFYSRFSPSPLSMKQFLDFGESPSSRSRPLPLLPEVPVRSGAAGTPHPVSAARLVLLSPNAVLCGRKELCFLLGQRSPVGSVPETATVTRFKFSRKLQFLAPPG